MAVAGAGTLRERGKNMAAKQLERLTWEEFRDKTLVESEKLRLAIAQLNGNLERVTAERNRALTKLSLIELAMKL